ncbi:hypothetical protein SM0020_01890 [Sinorhizobium meliloti CCNWSX0020]|uniref:Uncharacterized protein n=1 Tax=Sinorhizobium meliloti CCNWSX0020 TaxID=1107881 RepID=H0FTB3_RHIML|nr:hypothetical protein SM0020_01890 [Sinorhizobium meliloti CCNWSX0020]
MFSETQITQQIKRESVLRCSVTDHADHRRAERGAAGPLSILPRIVRNRLIRRLFFVLSMAKGALVIIRTGQLGVNHAFMSSPCGLHASDMKVSV